MKIRTKFLLFLLLVHACALVLAFIAFRQQQLVFILMEAVLLVMAAIGFKLYRQVTEPLRLLLSGLDAIRDKDFNVKFMPTGKKETDQLIQVYNEMIDRLREERTKQEQQHFFLDKLIQTSPTGIIILDYDEQISEINPKAQLMLGLPPETPFQDLPLGAIDHPIAQAAAALQNGETRTVNLQGAETYKCRRAYFVDRGFARPFITIEELTAEILRAEKNAFGKVIRMMAHEVNNSIGAVNSLLQSFRRHGEEWSEEDHQDLQEALNVSIARNERLNRFMRNFADVVRLPVPVKENYPLDQLLRSVAQLMRGPAAEREVELILALPQDEVRARIDVQQMELVLINAVKNALESIGRNGQIELKLSARPLTLFVRDNGPGIPPALEKQLFSPFFSTKREGQGIGLTLSREILLNHDLSFSLKTQPDGWTEFRIVFP